MVARGRELGEGRVRGFGIHIKPTFENHCLRTVAGRRAPVLLPPGVQGPQDALCLSQLASRRGMAVLTPDPLREVELPALARREHGLSNRSSQDAPEKLAGGTCGRQWRGGRGVLFHSLVDRLWEL